MRGNPRFHFFSGTTKWPWRSVLIVFNFEQGCSKLSSRGDRPMGGKSAFVLREKAARTNEVLASIGQGLREQYDAPQALSDRLAELVRRIEQSTDSCRAEGKAMSSTDYRRYAAELLKIADGISDYQSRAALIAMAQRWHHLAARAEKNPPTVLGYETPEPRRQQRQANPQTKDRPFPSVATCRYGPSLKRRNIRKPVTNRGVAMVGAELTILHLTSQKEAKLWLHVQQNFLDPILNLRWRRLM